MILRPGNIYKGGISDEVLEQEISKLEDTEDDQEIAKRAILIALKKEGEADRDKVWRRCGALKIDLCTFKKIFEEVRELVLQLATQEKAQKLALTGT